MWQVQYLVKGECDFSWQVQDFVIFWEITGARIIVFSIQHRFQDRTGKVSEAAGTKWRFFLLFGLSSDSVRIILESSLFWWQQFQGFLTLTLNSETSNRRNIWRSWNNLCKLRADIYNHSAETSQWYAAMSVWFSL